MDGLIFQDVEVGFPDSIHDAQVLQNSNIFTWAKNREILTGPPVSIGGNDIRPYLVGDSAYPLSNWLIKPFPERTNDPQEIEVNKELSSAQWSALSV